MSEYAVHQYYKRSKKCSICLHFLTIDEEFLLDHSEDTKYQYFKFVDRGSLKWPSDVALEAVVMIYKIFVAIDKHVENTSSDTWRDVCHSCNTPY